MSQLKTDFSLQSWCLRSYYFFTTVLGVQLLFTTHPGLWLVIPQGPAKQRHLKSLLTALGLSPQTGDGWELGPHGKMSLVFDSEEKSRGFCTPSKWLFFFLVIITNSDHSSPFFFFSPNGQWQGTASFIWIPSQPSVLWADCFIDPVIKSRMVKCFLLYANYSWNQLKCGPFPAKAP